MPPTTKCLTCDKTAMARGLCQSCRTVLGDAIHRGHLTMEDAIEANLILPAYRPKKNPMRAAIEKLLADKTKQ